MAPFSDIVVVFVVLASSFCTVVSCNPLEETCGAAGYSLLQRQSSRHLLEWRSGQSAADQRQQRTNVTNVCRIGPTDTVYEYTRGSWTMIPPYVWEAQVSAAKNGLAAVRKSGVWDPQAAQPRSVAEALAGVACSAEDVVNRNGRSQWLCSRRPEFPQGVNGEFETALMHRDSSTFQDLTTHDEERTLAALKLQWTPHNCVLPEAPRSAEGWAAVLQPQLHAVGARRILFVGDSLSTQHVSAFTCMLNTAPLSATHRRSSVGKAMVSLYTTDLNGGTAVMLARSDMLFSDHGLADTEAMWFSVLEAAFPNSSASNRFGRPHDVVIINSGAHWEDKLEDFGGAINIAAQALAVNFAGHVVWRSNVQGNPGCVSSPSAEFGGYNWNLFPQFDRKAVLIFQREAALTGRFTVMNASFVGERSDGRLQTQIFFEDGKHDCLHWCIPGPGTEIYNRLLYSFLLQSM